MNRLSKICGQMKRLYRHIGNDILQNLNKRGFTDLRLSYLEILTYLCEQNEGDHGAAPSMKSIGEACGLKKQTVTGHLNDLQAKGYINRMKGLDKRENKIVLTEYGKKFKLALIESYQNSQSHINHKIGSINIDKLDLVSEAALKALDSTFGLVKPFNTTSAQAETEFLN